MSKARDLLKSIDEVTFSGGGSDDPAKAFKILGTKPQSSIKSVGIASYGTGLEDINHVQLKQLLGIKSFVGISYNKISKLEVMFDEGSDDE